MSTTTLTPNESGSAPVNGTGKSPVDYVRSLPPEDKQAVFLALLREALQWNGDRGLMPLVDEEGKPFGYYVPQKAADAIAERELPKLTPEREQELHDRAVSREPGIPIRQVIDELKQEWARLQSQSQ